MAPELTLAELSSMSAGSLESLWARDVSLVPPSGLYRGRVLSRIDNATSRSAFWRWSQWLAFEGVPFGLDFDRGLWFFCYPGMALGRFEARPGASRWRDTDALGLHYGASRLPRVVRGVLYDEVKPVCAGLMLGMGGINAERGVGEHFWFGLERTHCDRGPRPYSKIVG